MQAELENSRNKVEGLGRLHSTRSRRVASISSARTLPYPPCGGRRASGRGTLLAQRRSLLGLGTSVPVHWALYCRQQWL